MMTRRSRIIDWFRRPRAFLRHSFSQANGTNLNAAAFDVGPTAWTIGAGTWEVNAGAGRKTATDATLQAISAEAGRSDVVVEVDVVPATSSYGGIVGRLVDASNYWLVQFDEALAVGNSLTIHDVVAGAATSRAGCGAGDGFANGVSARMRAVFNGNLIQAWVNGTLPVFYASATFQATATKFGILGFTINVPFSRFRVSSLR